MFASVGSVCQCWECMPVCTHTCLRERDRGGGGGGDLGGGAKGGIKVQKTAEQFGPLSPNDVNLREYANRVSPSRSPYRLGFRDSGVRGYGVEESAAARAGGPI